jgi:hypothetical protein
LFDGHPAPGQLLEVGNHDPVCSTEAPVERKRHCAVAAGVGSLPEHRWRKCLAEGQCRKWPGNPILSSPWLQQDWIHGFRHRWSRLRKLRYENGSSPSEVNCGRMNVLENRSLARFGSVTSIWPRHHQVRSGLADLPGAIAIFAFGPIGDVGAVRSFACFGWLIGFREVVECFKRSLSNAVDILYRSVYCVPISTTEMQT